MSPQGAFTTASFIPKTIALQATIVVLEDRTIAVYKANGEQALVAPIDSFKLNGTGNAILNKSDIEIGGVKYIFREDRAMSSPLTALGGVIGLASNATQAASTADFFHQVESIRDGAAPMPAATESPAIPADSPVTQPSISTANGSMPTAEQAVVARRSSQGKKMKRLGLGLIILSVVIEAIYIFFTGLVYANIVLWLFIMGIVIFFRGVYEDRKLK